MALLAGAIEPTDPLTEFAADLAPDLRDFLLWATKLPAVAVAIDALLRSPLGIILAMADFFAVFIVRPAVTAALLADLAEGFVDDFAVITFFLFVLPLEVPLAVVAFFFVRVADCFAPALVSGLRVLLPEGFVLDAFFDFLAGELRGGEALRLA